MFIKLVILYIVKSIAFSQSIQINEIVSSNQSTYYDEDGDTPDWIELFNPTASSVSISNWGLSDDVNDIERYYKTIKQDKKLDAVLGTRFSKDSKVSNYPFFKLFLNRIANNVIKLIFFSDFNDFTNAFKIYKRKTLVQFLPIVSENFNVFLELPLKIITRNYFYKVISINWKGRTIGESKFKIKEMSSMYIFTLLYCLFEKILLNKKHR